MQTNYVTREEFLEETGQIKVEIAEMKKDIKHLSDKIDSIANVRAWVIAFGAVIAALTGIANLIKLFS